MSGTICIIEEPRGSVYLDLLRLAIEQCASYSLVWRDQFEFTTSANQLRHDLRRYLIRQERTDEWPGTNLG